MRVVDLSFAKQFPPPMVLWVYTGVTWALLMLTYLQQKIPNLFQYFLRLVGSTKQTSVLKIRYKVKVRPKRVNTLLKVKQVFVYYYILFMNAMILIFINSITRTKQAYVRLEHLLTKGWPLTIRDEDDRS